MTFFTTSQEFSWKKSKFFIEVDHFIIQATFLFIYFGKKHFTELVICITALLYFLFLNIENLMQTTPIPKII